MKGQMIIDLSSILIKLSQNIDLNNSFLKFLFLPASPDESPLLFQSNVILF